MGKNIYKYITSASKNVYIYRLAEIVNDYSNRYRKIIKMKLIDGKLSTYSDFGRGNEQRDTKFQVDDHVRISKYKNIFEKVYTPNWSEEDFVIKKLKKKMLHGHVNWSP